MRITQSSTLLVLSAGLLLGCAHAPKSYSKRIIDRPAGERVVPGAAQSTSYTTQVSMEHNIAHIRVLERSVCPVIKLRVVDRIEETLDGEKVVERVPQGAQEFAETQSTFMQCEARFARVPVALQYGADTYPLGNTDEMGQLRADLGSAMKVNTRGVDLSQQTGQLLVAGAPAAEISMAGLLKQQQRVDQIVAQLTPLLGKDATKTNDADVTNAAMLYEELRELAPDDARTLALQRRFVEVVGGFKDVQRTEQLRRNLGALSEAKEVLAALSAAAPVPQYVQLSIAREAPSPDAISWATAQAILALRKERVLCNNGLDWGRLDQLEGPARVAFSYLRFAYDQSELAFLCAR